MWITVDVERALYVDRGRNVILCELMPGHQTLVLKLKGSEMRASSKCWICGEEEPHTHSQDEVERARVRDAYADIIEPTEEMREDAHERWLDLNISGQQLGAAVNAAKLTLNEPQGVPIPPDTEAELLHSIKLLMDQCEQLRGEYQRGLDDAIKAIRAGRDDWSSGEDIGKTINWILGVAEGRIADLSRTTPTVSRPHGERGAS
ncbi:hypothetical protein IVA94_14610 [Bradyrhizobium sp. 156]|uniref:hypothetical protein n=1 Tax=Bradyrhizobium sp. 156 TaxID=2782630 RepID=UPI001FF95028|nr:hypothetical protein [Bradyrhizobium sp. 156]MCK1322100.1 hypothetical protein [Bradyrhizobium sp. 156]